MTTKIPDEFGQWFAIKVSYPGFQELMYRNAATGEVVVVEEITGPYQDGETWQARVLPQEFKENPIPHHKMGKHDEPGDAIAQAKQYMEENPDGKTWY